MGFKVVTNINWDVGTIRVRKINNNVMPCVRKRIVINTTYIKIQHPKHIQAKYIILFILVYYSSIIVWMICIIMLGQTISIIQLLSVLLFLSTLRKCLFVVWQEKEAVIFQNVYSKNKLKYIVMKDYTMVQSR